MELRRPLVLAGLALVLVGALIAGSVLLDRSGVPSGSRGGHDAAIAAQVTLSPRVLLFGDTIRAQIDVRLDQARVDPESVRVAADVTPFEIVAPPSTVTRKVGGTSIVRTTLVLRCAGANCLPLGQSERYDLPPARVSFLRAGGQADPASPIRLALPSIRVYSRFAALASDAERAAAPWQADLLSLPAVSYRADDRLLVALLLAGAALAALGGLVLAYRAWPRRAPAPPPEPEPVPVLSPLEQALVLLERSIIVDGAPGQRRALELVAEELDHAEWGDRELARAARSLAWSEDIPPVAETTRLAARVRRALPPPDEALNGAGVRV